VFNPILEVTLEEVAISIEALREFVVADFPGTERHPAPPRDLPPAIRFRRRTEGMSKRGVPRGW
jgi:hypothetical protein